jgi:hypothetical protein
MCCLVRVSYLSLTWRLADGRGLVAVPTGSASGVGESGNEFAGQSFAAEGLVAGEGARYQPEKGHSLHGLAAAHPRAATP